MRLPAIFLLKRASFFSYLPAGAVGGAIGGLLAILLLMGGFPGKEDEQAPQPSLLELPALWAAGQAHDLPTLIDSTGTVFVGTVIAADYERTEDLLPEAARAELGQSERGTVPVTGFRISVTRSLAGQVAAEEIVEQITGTTAGRAGPFVDVILEDDERLQVGETYLFFSYRKENGTLTSAPFARFQLEDDGRLSAVWPSTGVAKELEGERLQAAIAEVTANAE